MHKVQTHAVKLGLVAAVLIVVLSGCDSSSGVTIDSAALTNIPDTGNLGVNNPVDITNPTNTISSGPSHIISGDISVLGDGLPLGEISVRVRGTEVQALRQEDGRFYLAVPTSDIEGEAILEFTGENVVEKNVSLKIATDSTDSSIDTTLAARTPPITFNLATGGVLQNEGSPTRTSVSVPANAFQFSDGTFARGMAQVNITEVDTHNLEADHSWVPNLIGIPEGETEATPIRTFGMSEFHFSQDGRTLDLRPGASATLSMDLAAPFIVTDDTNMLEEPFVDAFDGAELPLWYFDTEDLVWREEGGVVISADNESSSGFTATGEVGHFTYWNIDYQTPFLIADVHILVVDQVGNPRTDVEETTFHTYVGIPPEAGPSAHEGEGMWSNTALLTPSKNTIQVIGNAWDKSGAGRISMDIAVSKVTAKGLGVISTGVMKQNKIFDEAVGDYSVYFEVVVPVLQPPKPEMKAVDVVIELVDLDGNSRSDIGVSSYKVKIETIGVTGDYRINNTTTLTPSRPQVAVIGNTVEYLESGADPISMRISLENLIVDIDGGMEITFFAPVSVERTFNSNDDDTVILRVPVVDL